MEEIWSAAIHPHCWWSKENKMSVTGQIQIATPGVAVQGPSSPNGSLFMLKGHPNNAGLVLVSDEQTSGSTGGFPLAAGDTTLRKCSTLGGLWFNTDMANSKLVWFLIE